MSRRPQHFDLVIVGGGMVGASLARALAGTGFEIAIIEVWPQESGSQPSYDDRAIALSYGTRVILESIGVWGELRPWAEPIRHIHVSDRGRFGVTRLDHADHAVEALGYVATGQRIGKALFQGVEQLPNIHLFCPATLQYFTVEDELVEVCLLQDDHEVVVTTDLLVAADGVNSQVRKALGVEMREWTYGQHAVISNLLPGVEPAGVAYERFTDDGPMAMLPLTEGRYGLVWTVGDDDLEHVMALTDRQFLAQVQERFGNRLGAFRMAGRRSSYPLKLLQVREHVRPGVALIGNAAHAVHPITGQGFNLGIRDVAVLADVLVDARDSHKPIGSLAVLEEYARWRRRDQQAVAFMTDGLVRLFTNPLLPIRLGRNLGMLAMDLSPTVKHWITRQFMGVNGRLPRLARGLRLDHAG